MKIGELAKKAGVTTRTIRYYEELGINAHRHRSSVGFRLYSEKVLLKLRLVNHLKELLLPLDKIKQTLSVEENTDDLGSVMELLSRKLSETEERLIDYLKISQEVNYSGVFLENCHSCELRPSQENCSNCEDAPVGKIPIPLKSVF